MKLAKIIAEKIKDTILKGEITGNEKLPSIRELAARENISHVTASNVYKELENEGLIENTAKGFVVRHDTSEYVLDYYQRQIENGFFQIKEAAKKLSYDDQKLFDYLKMLNSLSGGI